MKLKLDAVINTWNGTRYDVTGHNCNFFTNALLIALGAPGLDQEYLEASGIAKGLNQIPGTTLLQEVPVKWPISDKRLDVAFMDEIRKLARLPEDIVSEVERFSKRLGISSILSGSGIPGIPGIFR
ncbi:hypothetical protein [Paenibacillus sp. 1A_MP2]|uniref:hypothetical protein n=1 Tax=Paenibacillus sp. 1A_MP2 TaxID=3457495 RepID=UPI003FCC4ED7